MVFCVYTRGSVILKTLNFFREVRIKSDVGVVDTRNPCVKVSRYGFIKFKKSGGNESKFEEGMKT